jgi:hypothetical protein
MTEFEVGDRVRVTRKLRNGEDDHDCGWLPSMDGMVGKEYTIEHISEFGNCRLGAFYFPPAVLRRVGKSPAARILFEKILVNGVKCRRITGFEGILGGGDLPDAYISGAPAFWLHDPGLRGAHVFDGAKMDWQHSDGSEHGISLELPPGTKIGVGGWYFAGMHVGDVWPESTYQELLVWLKRAGSRLAKIRQQEREAWSGSGADEI